MSYERKTQFNYLYSKVEGKRCAYCGQGKEVMDHSPPLHWVGLLQPEFFKERKIPFKLYPACTDCNYILGAKRLFTYKERVKYIYEYLSVNEYDLRMTDPISMEERQEYSGRLREEIRAQVYRQLRAWERFEFAQKKAK